MNAPREFDPLDVVGDWQCVARQGRALPAVEGDRCVVAGELTLGTGGTFSMTRLEVVIASRLAVAAIDPVISDKRALEGRFTFCVESPTDYTVRASLTLVAMRSVRTVSSDAGCFTEDGSAAVKLTMAMPSFRRLCAVASESGTEAGYEFEKSSENG